MKVLHITTIDSGGAGLCCLRIHQALLNLGIESKVLTLKNTQHVKEEYSYGYFLEKLSRIPSKICRMIGVTGTERNELIKLSRENDNVLYSLPVSPINLLNNKLVKWADIIHLHWVCNYVNYSTFFKQINKPVIWTLHDEYFFYGIAHYSDQVLKNNELEKHYAQVKRDALAHLKNLSVVLLSEFYFKKFRDHDLLKGRNVKVINNPVDSEKFAPVSKENRKSFGLTDEDIVFAFIAMNINEKRKGLNVLSKVLFSIDPCIKILAIGENTLKVSWPNVISTGAKSTPQEICELLSLCNYYAMPSYQEAFAQSPMEAMACGLPTVVYPVSGTSELINERNGVVCDDFTPESLKKGIQTLMSRKYYPKEIRQDMINRFSSDTIAHNYVELYYNALHL